MEMFYIKLTSLKGLPIEEVPVCQTGQLKQSLDSFYVTDSPLSVTNIAQMAMFYLSVNDFPLEVMPDSQTCQFK